MVQNFETYFYIENRLARMSISKYMTSKYIILYHDAKNFDRENRSFEGDDVLPTVINCQMLI